MSAAQASARVLNQLEHALSFGHVPDEEKRRAAQLLARLKSTVRVVLIGRPGSGKSRLINLLTGRPVVPEIGALPPLEVTFGATERTVYLMSDGSEQSLEGIQLDLPPPANAAIVRAEMPLPVLKQLSLTEVCLEGSPDDQRTIAGWAMSRADIVLWCSQEFDAAEQALWASATDALKDHSFLVLTKADQLQMKGVLSDRLTDLQDIAEDAFFRMLPVATIQAISANPGGGVRDENIWASSGGKALTDAVQRLVSTGRRADADNALLFLRRNAPDIPHDIPPPVAPEKPAKPRLAGAAPNGPGHPGGPDHPDGKADARGGATDTHVFRDALEFLQQRADQMLCALRENGGDKQTFLLDHCLETTNRLSEIIMGVDASGPPLSELQDDVLECGDMIVLFHLEKTEDAATDAVTLLLQLKKEMAVAVSP